MNRHFVEKFNQNLDSEHFVKAKSQGLIFSVEHYAGQVSHNLDVSFYPRSDKYHINLLSSYTVIEGFFMFR